MLIITEISESVNADRKGIHANSDYFKLLFECSVSYNWYNEDEKNKIWSVFFEREIKDTVEDELADIVIRCLDYAGLNKINIECRIILSYRGHKYIKFSKYEGWQHGICGVVHDPNCKCNKHK